MTLRQLYGNQEEMIIHIISECIKLAQRQYKTRYDWEGKVIHRELYKKLKFDRTNKYKMIKLKYIQMTEGYKILRDFEINTDYLIPAWRQDLVITEKMEPKRKSKRSS